MCACLTCVALSGATLSAHTALFLKASTHEKLAPRLMHMQRSLQISSYIHLGTHHGLNAGLCCAMAHNSFLQSLRIDKAKGYIHFLICESYIFHPWSWCVLGGQLMERFCSSKLEPMCGTVQRCMKITWLECNDHMTCTEFIFSCILLLQ